MSRNLELDIRLREFIIPWMRENGYEVPAAATPEELLEAIVQQANHTGWANGVVDS